MIVGVERNRTRKIWKIDPQFRFAGVDTFSAFRIFRIFAFRFFANPLSAPVWTALNISFAPSGLLRFESLLRSKLGCMCKGTRPLVPSNVGSDTLIANHVTVSSLVAPARSRGLVFFQHEREESERKDERRCFSERGNKNEKVSSPVWEFFGYFKSDRSQTNVVCKLCKTVVPTKSGNTTNYLFDHLSRVHPSGAQPRQTTTFFFLMLHKCLHLLHCILHVFLTLLWSTLLLIIVQFTVQFKIKTFKFSIVPSWSLF